MATTRMENIMTLDRLSLIALITLATIMIIFNRDLADILGVVLHNLLGRL